VFLLPDKYLRKIDSFIIVFIRFVKTNTSCRIENFGGRNLTNRSLVADAREMRVMSKNGHLLNKFDYLIEIVGFYKTKPVYFGE
jgi:hypothetical protein